MDKAMSGLVGMKFVDQGRDAAVGLDCWGLVIEAYRREGMWVPDFRVGAFAFAAIGAITDAECGSPRWIEVEEPVDADAPLVVLMRMHKKYITHAGVYIGKGQILHTTGATNAVMARIDSLKPVIVGYYRYDSGN